MLDTKERQITWNELEVAPEPNLSLTKIRELIGDGKLRSEWRQQYLEEFIAFPDREDDSIDTPFNRNHVIRFWNINEIRGQCTPFRNRITG